MWMWRHNDVNSQSLNDRVTLVSWLCWGLTSQSTIFQSYRDGAIASWVINQYFRGVKCLAQGHNTAAVGLEPRTSRSGVRHSTTEPPRSPSQSYVTYTTNVLTTKVGKKAGNTRFPRMVGNTGNSQEILGIPGKYWDLLGNSLTRP